jgi:uncharacterized protein (UPF0210 family)
MKIRSITCFVNVGWPLDNQALEKTARFSAVARAGFEESGYEVQTTRLATTPFPHLAADHSQALALAQSLEAAASAAGFAYLSLGPALPEAEWSYTTIPELVAATKNVFFSGSMSTKEGKIVLPAVRACAEIIARLAPLSADGFANLRFAALANVPAGSPFFPAAYHTGNKPAFALATEAADLAVAAFTQANTLQAARQQLVLAIEKHGRRLSKVARALEKTWQIPFQGIDFSLAPFPEQARSLGEAMQRLGVPAVGLHGSLAAAAIIAECVDRASFPHTGFSGLMLPVLEDSVLAARASEGCLTIKDLLLYSAVCGTGLDTVPLPGDTSVTAIQALLLDLAVLAHRLNKPLTARLMPIPGKAAGELTEFDFAYFANSRVMALEAGSLHSALAGDESFILHSREARR